MRTIYHNCGVNIFINHMSTCHRLDQPIAQMMLPEGVANANNDSLALPDIDTTAVMLKLAECIGTDGNATESLALIDEGTVADANQSLIKFSDMNDIQSAMHMYGVMKVLDVPVEQKVLARLITTATKARDFTTADSLFEEAILDESKEITMEIWSAKILSLSHQNKAKEAEGILDELCKLRLTPLPSMYSSILGAYIRQRDFETAYRFWERMHVEGVDIDLRAFRHMFRYCLMKGMAEKAMFFWDEMNDAYKLHPTQETCASFLEAVGMAPHFVPGFEDYLFDAMARVEGKELVPDAPMYEAIILGFARARDPVAAEYYFWEMKRKGIEPTRSAYAALLQSYYMAQCVGAGRYGALGRYSKPPEKIPSEEEQDMIDLGPVRVGKICKLFNFC